MFLIVYVELRSMWLSSSFLVHWKEEAEQFQTLDDVRHEEKKELLDDSTKNKGKWVLTTGFFEYSPEKIRFYQFLTQIIVWLGMAQMACFMLIAVVRVDEFPTFHNVVAFLTVIFTVARETVMLYRRSKLGVAKSIMLWAHGLLIFSMVVLAITYFVLVKTCDEECKAKTHYAIIEYYTFGLCIFVPIFSVVDVVRLRVAEKKNQ